METRDMEVNTTNPTPAEIAALERRIAKNVLGWSDKDRRFCLTHRSICWQDKEGNHVARQTWQTWSPWRNPADALEVLERLERITGRLATIEHLSATWLVVLGDGEDYDGQEAGQHFGPAVCLLAEQVMKVR